MSPIGVLRGIKPGRRSRKENAHEGGERSAQVVIPAAAAYDGATI